MGYRSDVAYTIRFTNDSEFNLFVTEVKAKGGAVLEALNECRVKVRERQINFYTESVKWYDSFPDVQSHLALIDLAKDWLDSMEERNIRDDEGRRVYPMGWAFVRIGEDASDIEEDRGGDIDIGCLCVTRHIDCDFEVDMFEEGVNES